ncbi:MAG: HEAT repeat domain-containing protein [Candidatus Riflebacteria bacterium]|nr:HEAT repeat domain-containing protein [Candidatus Riflebacteria bacterium]
MDKFAEDLERRLFEALAQQARDPEAARRVDAVYRLVELGKAAGTAELLRQLADGDPDVDVRYHARRLLAELRQDGTRAAPLPEQPLEALGNPAAREAALRALLARPDPAAAPELVRLLETEDSPRTLASVIAALGKCGTDQHVGSLRPFLRHANQRIVANAVEAIYAMAGEESLPFLVPLVDSPDNRVAANVLVALASVHPEAVVHRVALMARSSRLAMRASAVWSMEQFEHPGLEPILLERLAVEPQPELCKRIAGRLAAVGTEQSLRSLLAIASAQPGRSPYCESVREAVVERLGLGAEQVAALEAAEQPRFEAALLAERRQDARRREEGAKASLDRAREDRLDLDAAASWMGRMRRTAHRHPALCLGAVLLFLALPAGWMLGSSTTARLAETSASAVPGKTGKTRPTGTRLAEPPASSEVTVVRGQVRSVAGNTLVVKNESAYYLFRFDDAAKLRPVVPRQQVSVHGRFVRWDGDLGAMVMRADSMSPH